MEEVTTRLLEVSVTFGHDLPLFLPICRPVFFPREVALDAFQPLAFVGQVEQFDGSPIGIVSVLENPYVDADAPLGILGLRGWAVLGFDAEDGVLLPGGFAFDCDGLYLGLVGEVTVEGDGDFSEFREPQSDSATRVLELEAGLTVGETSVLVRCFPLEVPRGSRCLCDPGASRDCRTTAERLSEEPSSERFSGRSTTS